MRELSKSKIRYLHQRVKFAYMGSFEMCVRVCSYGKGWRGGGRRLHGDGYFIGLNKLNLAVKSYLNNVALGMLGMANGPRWNWYAFHFASIFLRAMHETKGKDVRARGCVCVCVYSYYSHFIVVDLGPDVSEWRALRCVTALMCMCVLLNANLVLLAGQVAAHHNVAPINVSQNNDDDAWCNHRRRHISSSHQDKVY